MAMIGFCQKHGRKTVNSPDNSCDACGLVAAGLPAWSALIMDAIQIAVVIAAFTFLGWFLMNLALALGEVK